MRHGLKKILTVVALVLVLGELLYIGVASLLLNGPWLQRLLSRDPDTFEIAWSSGWSLTPGYFRVRGLDMGGQTRRQQWRIATDEAAFRLDLWALPFRAVRFHGLKTGRLVASLKDRPTGSIVVQTDPASVAGSTAGMAPEPTVPELTAPASYVESMRAGAVGQIPAPAVSPAQPDPCRQAIFTGDAASRDEPPRWNIVIGDLLAHEFALDYYGFRLRGKGRLAADGICLVTRGAAAVTRADVRLEAGDLVTDRDPVAQDLRVSGHVSIHPLVLADHPGAKALRFVSGTLEVAGEMESLDFLNHYPAVPSWSRVFGRGRVKGRVSIARGVLGVATALEVAAPELGLEVGGQVDGQGTIGLGRGFRIGGAGRVDAYIDGSGEVAQTRARVTLSEMAMRQLSGLPVLMEGEDFVVEASGPALDLATYPALPAMTLQWKDAVMPDVAVLHDYLPDGLPFRLARGSARLSGHLDQVDGHVSGTIDFAAEAVGGEVFGRPVEGQLGVELVVADADLPAGRIDLAGSGIRLAALTSAADGQMSGPGGETLIRCEELLLRTSGILPGVARDMDAGAGPLWTGAAIRLSGEVSDIGFLNGLLPREHGVEVAGGADVTADLQIDEGRILPGARLRVGAARLSTRFLDFAALGKGVVEVFVEGDARHPDARVEVKLSDVGIRGRSDPVPYLRNATLRLSGGGRLLDWHLDGQQALERLETRVEIQGAEVPDLRAYNRYLPRGAAMSLLAGRGTLEADLRLRGQTGGGTLSLTGRQAKIGVRDQAVTGDLRLQVRLSKGHLGERTFEVSGSRLRIENAALDSDPKSAQALWWGQLDLLGGQVAWRQPLTLDADVGIALRDSGLFVRLFFGERLAERKHLQKLLTIENVTGTSRVSLQPDSLRLTNARLASGKLRLLASLRLGAGSVHGGLYGKYGLLGVGVEVDGDRRDWKLLNARQWYEAYEKAFSVAAR